MRWRHRGPDAAARAREVVLALNAAWHSLTTAEGWRFYHRHMTRNAAMSLEDAILQRADAISVIRDDQPWSSIAMHDIHVVDLTESSALVSYRVHAERRGTGCDLAAVSVYVLDSGRWQIAFHQQLELHG